MGLQIKSEVSYGCFLLFVVAIYKHTNMMLEETRGEQRERQGKKVPFLAFFSVLLTGLDPPQ